jgi:hypothetical protein
MKFQMILGVLCMLYFIILYKEAEGRQIMNGNDEKNKFIIKLFEKYLKKVKQRGIKVDKTVLVKFIEFIAKIGQKGIFDRETSSKIYIGDPILRFG